MKKLSFFKRSNGGHWVAVATLAQKMCNGWQRRPV